MKYLKLIALLISTITNLKPIILITNKYDKKQLANLFSQLYFAINDITPLEITKEEFVNLATKWIDFLLKVVNLIWYLNPELCHALVWKYVEVERSLWLKVVEKLEVYAQESSKEIETKISYYSHLYNQDILSVLIAKDLEVQLQKFDYYWKESVIKGIDEIRNKFSDGPPSGDNWVFYYDGYGLHINPNKK